MGTMNYSNFIDDDAQLVPASSAEVDAGHAATYPVEVVEDTQYEFLPTSGRNRSGEALASAISPYAALVSIGNSLVDLVSDISKCIALVKFKKNETEQIKAKVYAEIEESKQKTKRVKIHEKEMTERLIIQCKENLAEKEMELRKLCEENRFREFELKKSHKLYQQQLKRMDLIIESIIKQKDALLQKLPDVIDETSKLETILSSFDDANKRLIDISDKIVALQKR